MKNSPTKYYLALDVSTTCIGVALFGPKGKLSHLTHIKLDSSKDVDPNNRYIEKAKLFKKYIIEFKRMINEELGGEVVNIFVEEPLGSSNNVNTAIMLAKFNGIVCYILNQIYDVIPQLFTIHSIRKTFCPEFITRKVIKGELKETLSFPKDIDKKEYIRKKVAEKEKQIEWLYGKKQNLLKENWDMSDSYAVGYHGLKIEKII
jgi:hypothetical protein